MNAPDFTIADVLAFARTKPADERYHYTNCRRCAVAQFLRGSGHGEDATAFPGFWHDGLGSAHDFDDRIDDAAQGTSRDSQTFGQFADRLEALAVTA